MLFNIQEYEPLVQISAFIFQLLILQLNAYTS